MPIRQNQVDTATELDLFEPRIAGAQAVDHWIRPDTRRLCSKRTSPVMKSRSRLRTNHENGSGAGPGASSACCRYSIHSLDTDFGSLSSFRIVAPAPTSDRDGGRVLVGRSIGLLHVRSFKNVTRLEQIGNYGQGGNLF